MTNRKKSVSGLSILATALLSFMMMGNDGGCSDGNQAQSASGVKKASVKVQTDKDGNTVEQKAIMERVRRDNLPGSIKHLYLISAYSGQVIMYSTVKGKVTSSSKRLTPSTVAYVADTTGSSAFTIDVGGIEYTTQEVLGDDGTYGSSMPYLFWFDAKDVYHQQYVSGGVVLHTSDQPVHTGKVIMNLETPQISPPGEAEATPSK